MRFPAARLLVCILFSALCLMTGCKRRSAIIDLTEAPILQVDSQWALVLDPYAIYREEPGLAATATGYGRRGDLQELKGLRIMTENKVTTIWYQFDSGWLPETSVQIYSNQLKAATAARELEAARDSSR
ncbi:MAG: hypothetical protein IJW57_11515 [Spirochaetaceae bacterium]|nr:hypothetical protein [Spirochaetaceae bacterium]